MQVFSGQKLPLTSLWGEMQLKKTVTCCCLAPHAECLYLVPAFTSWSLSSSLSPNPSHAAEGPELLCLDQDRPSVEASCVCKDVIGNPVGTSPPSRTQSSVVGGGGAGVGYVPLGASTQMAGVCSSRCCLIVTTARHNNNWNVYNTCIFSRVLAHALA